MRNSLLTAAFTALVATAWSPSAAQAQIITYPQVSAYPYLYSPYYTPTYNYNYAWTNPYYSTRSYGWSNPYNYGNYVWTSPTPFYSPYNYGYGWPQAGYGRFWRW